MTMETTKRKYTMTMETTKRKYTRKNPRQAADTLFRVWIKSKSKFYVHGFGHKSSWAYQAKADEMARAAEKLHGEVEIVRFSLAEVGRCRPGEAAPQPATKEDRLYLVHSRECGPVSIHRDLSEARDARDRQTHDEEMSGGRPSVSITAIGLKP